MEIRALLSLNTPLSIELDNAVKAISPVPAYVADMESAVVTIPQWGPIVQNLRGGPVSLPLSKTYSNLTLEFRSRSAITTSQV
ncbi:MAG: hypothetical protein DRQ88_11145 [Epsilonproteobacteria bacterium]|nr:MAG: hypothetical protein DRQ89_06015 [Campylobacterota bacterium]RLA64301.1 MAG: hypothetical protein DRQ88_11145 [Campylobacterota bacterium]